MMDFTVASDKITLHGCLQEPARGEPPWPCVLLCHGIPSGDTPDPNDAGYPALMAEIGKQGAASVYFNFRGTGASEGDFSIGGWLRDIEAMADALLYGREPFEDIDTGRIGVLAFSGGAAVTIDAAARHHHFQAVACMASPADLAALMPRDSLGEILAHWKAIGIIRDPAYPQDLDEFYREVVSLSPIRHVGDVAPTPLLLVHGSLDDVVPPAAAQQLFEAAGEPKEMRILPGAGHRLRLVPEAIGPALDWLFRYLV